MTMAGISSKALAFGNPENKYKFNDGTELNTAFDINLYETNFRSLDPQLGRFWQIDPMSESFEDLTLYGYANNNPILLNDPFGLASDTITLPAVTVIGTYKYLDTENGQVLQPIGFFHSLFSGQRKWNGILVDSKGYLQFLPDGTPHPGYTEFTMPDVGSRAGVRKATKFVLNKWLVYRAYKKGKWKIKTLYWKGERIIKKEILYKGSGGYWGRNYQTFRQFT
ncbi:MAG TPA: RHS repeat-associated core domain-containing protein [Chitinophagaceae bacterium]|nr:RHS repeat-associated core domain-containing protein [Chitinophagaceae bacterium]